MKKRVRLSEDAKERIGCFIMLVMLVAVLTFFFWRADRNTTAALKKLDYCIEHNLSDTDCQTQWDSIKGE